MTPADLTRIGKALYEPHSWKQKLADALINMDGQSINRRTVARWASGQNVIPPWAEDAIRELAKVRREEIKQALKG